MATLKKATPEQIERYAETQPVYPLGYVLRNVPIQGGGKATVAVEDLRCWSRPDPQWEAVAPDGYRWDEDMIHTLLCYDLADVRGRTGSAWLVPCEPGCSCGFPDHSTGKGAPYTTDLLEA